MYVDDDPDICEVVKTTLCLIAGLTVHTAGSGEQAIDLAYELRPDLVLMDVMMPGLDEDVMADTAALGSACEPAVLQQFLDFTYQLAHDVDASAHPAPSGAGMFRGPGGGR